MSVLELKAKIHQLVDEADDEAQLQTWFELLSGPLQDEEVEMTPEWEARIEKSIQSVREGRYITHEEMKKRMKEWPPPDNLVAGSGRGLPDHSAVPAGPLVG